jgi:hypothetical protein
MVCSETGFECCPDLRGTLTTKCKSRSDILRLSENSFVFFKVGEANLLSNELEPEWDKDFKIFVIHGDCGESSQSILQNCSSQTDSSCLTCLTGKSKKDAFGKCLSH